MEETTTEKVKSNNKIIVIITILLLVSIVLNVVFFVKNNKDKQEEQYLEHIATSVSQYSTFGIKTLIIQIIDDNGNVFDIVNEENGYYYYAPNTPLYRITTKDHSIANKTNVLKLYYKYNIKTTSGTVYNVSELLQLPIKIQNGQVYFTTLSNIEVKGINRGVIYFQRSLDFEVEIGFKKI